MPFPIALNRSVTLYLSISPAEDRLFLRQILLSKTLFRFYYFFVDFYFYANIATDYPCRETQTQNKTIRVCFVVTSEFRQLMQRAATRYAEQMCSEEIDARISSLSNTHNQQFYECKV